jgi:hypothetical protein
MFQEEGNVTNEPTWKKQQVRQSAHTKYRHDNSRRLSHNKKSKMSIAAAIPHELAYLV